MKKLSLFVTLIVAVLAAALPASALRYGFTDISSPLVAADAVIGQNQLFVDVTDSSGVDNLGATQALFTFRNIGTYASNIHEVYFDNGNPALSLASIVSVINGPGVAFTTSGVNPANLPGGNNVNPAFAVSTGLSADTIGSSQNGVDPGEYLGLLFSLKSGYTLGSVFSELASGALRLGLHVGGFPDGQSQSFVNTQIVTPPNPPAVPEPTTLLLVGFGLVGLAGLSHKIKKS